MAFAVAGVLTACAAQQARGIVPQSPNFPTSSDEVRRSWMSPEAKSRDLLYVVQSSTDIYVYSYPKGKLEGDIAGLHEPNAECVDKAGDVFVTDFYDEEIFEYPHGATKPSRTYDDPGFRPYNCSVSPVNGALAVANYLSNTSYQGNIVIYKPPSREPKTYFTDIKIPQMKACTYDDKGNLYVSGIGGTGQYGILRAGKHFIISLDLPDGLPDVMHWDGKHLDLIGNFFKGEILQYKISGQKGTKVGTVKLNGAKDFGYFWLQHPNVLAPKYNQSAVGVWRYPAGGSVVKSIQTAYRPAVFAVSRANH